MGSDHMGRRTECNSVQESACGTLHVVVFQDVPGQWIGRVLEHDMLTEARTIGEALRSIVRLVEAHSAFDRRHRRAPLSAFGGAPQQCWTAFTAGTPVALSQLGIDQPYAWHIVASIARQRPTTVPPPGEGRTGQAGLAGQA
jgi:hypothetical protein